MLGRKGVHRLGVGLVAALVAGVWLGPSIAGAGVETWSGGSSGSGAVLGRIVSKRMGLDTVFVHGAGYSNLKKGPGWMPGTAKVGGPGNAAIAGHRTAYGAPFGNIDKLKRGDKITIKTSAGTFDYFVTKTAIVPANALYVVETKNRTSSVLTLISCYPKYSTKQRIVVTAVQRSYKPPIWWAKERPPLGWERTLASRPPKK